MEREAENALDLFDGRWRLTVERINDASAPRKDIDHALKDDRDKRNKHACNARSKQSCRNLSRTLSPTYDGYTRHRRQADKTEAFFVEINDVTMEASIEVAQAYRPSTSGGQRPRLGLTRCWPRESGPTSWLPRYGRLDHCPCAAGGPERKHRRATSGSGPWLL
jgi:hypothetical protein